MIHKVSPSSPVLFEGWWGVFPPVVNYNYFKYCFRQHQMQLRHSFTLFCKVNRCHLATWLDKLSSGNLGKANSSGIFQAHFLLTSKSLNITTSPLPITPQTKQANQDSPTTLSHNLFSAITNAKLNNFITHHPTSAMPKRGLVPNPNPTYACYGFLQYFILQSP